MPIQSKAQWRALAVKRPDILHKWQNEAPRTFSKLPERKKPKREGPLDQLVPKP